MSGFSLQKIFFKNLSIEFCLFVNLVLLCVIIALFTGKTNANTNHRYDAQRQPDAYTATNGGHTTKAATKVNDTTAKTHSGGCYCEPFVGRNSTTSTCWTTGQRSATDTTTTTTSSAAVLSKSATTNVTAWFTIFGRWIWRQFIFIITRWCRKLFEKSQGHLIESNANRTANNGTHRHGH